MKRAWALAAILMTTLASSPAQAGCSRPIRVAYSPVDLAAITVEDGSVEALDRAFLDQVGARIGCEFVYDTMSRARAFQSLASGDTDLITSSFRTPKRDAFADLVVLYRARAMLFQRRDRQVQIRNTTEFVASGLSLDVVRGYDYGAGYRQLLDGVSALGRLAENVDPASIARKLAAERTDATVISALAFGRLAVEAGIDERLVVTALDDVPFYDVGVYLVRSALDPADRALLTNGLHTAVIEDRYAALLRNFFVRPHWVLAGLEFADGK